MQLAWPAKVAQVGGSGRGRERVWIITSRRSNASFVEAGKARAGLLAPAHRLPAHLPRLPRPIAGASDTSCSSPSVWHVTSSGRPAAGRRVAPALPARRRHSAVAAVAVAAARRWLVPALSRAALRLLSRAEQEAASAMAGEACCFAAGSQKRLEGRARSARHDYPPSRLRPQQGERQCMACSQRAARRHVVRRFILHNFGICIPAAAMHCRLDLRVSSSQGRAVHVLLEVPVVQEHVC